VTGYHIHKEAVGVKLFWMSMHQVRIKVML